MKTGSRDRGTSCIRALVQFHDIIYNITDIQTALILLVSIFKHLQLQHSMVQICFQRMYIYFQLQHQICKGLSISSFLLPTILQAVKALLSALTDLKTLFAEAGSAHLSGEALSQTIVIAFQKQNSYNLQSLICTIFAWCQKNKCLRSPREKINYAPFFPSHFHWLCFTPKITQMSKAVLFLPGGMSVETVNNYMLIGKVQMAIQCRMEMQLNEY